MIRHIIPIAILLCVAITTNSADWRQFRGPNASGIAKNANPPSEWDGQRNLKWRATLPGPGTSSPIIVGNRIFVTCYTGYGDGSNGRMEDLQRRLLAFDRKNGNELWQKSVKAALPEDNYNGYLTEHGYASHTPTSDGENVYAFFGKSGVHAYDMNGTRKWSYYVGRRSNNRRWGSAASLMLHDGKLIVNAADEARAIIALDPTTGSEIWKAPGDGLELAFGTPIVVDHDGRESLLIALPQELWGINPENGRLRWLAETGIPGNVSPSVVQGGGLVYAFGGYPTRATVAVKTGGSRDVSQSHKIWRISKTTYVPTPIYHDGHLYFVNDQGFAYCIHGSTGDIVYEERLPGLAGGRGRGGRPVYASAVMANGNYYAVTRQAGTYVIAAKPQFKVVAQNQIDSDRSQFNATPAIADNEIALRSDSHLHLFARQ